MLFKIDPAIFDQFPDVLLGVIVAKNIDNSKENKEILQLLREEENKIPDKIGQTSIVEHPNIINWREAYRKFGAKPKDYPSSIENLIRRVLKSESVRHINPLVDIYNYISLKYLVPVGGEDIDKISGDVLLTFAGKNEKPINLLGEPEAKSPHPGEVIYEDDNGAICRRWNWKEANRTKLTEETKNVVLVIETLPPVSRQILEEATKKLVNLVGKYCGGEIVFKTLDKDNLETLLK